MAHGYPDYEGGKSGLYLKPEWAAIEGTDKALGVSGTDKGYDETISVSYTVPAGKTLYLNVLAGSATASAAANGDSNQMFDVIIIKNAASVLYLAGNGGHSIPLNKPLVFDAGDLVTIAGRCKANHDCDLGAYALGYEVAG